MPLQRRGPPEERNRSTTIIDPTKKGYIRYLMPIEQDLIMSLSITIVHSSTLEDPLNHVTKISKIASLKVSNTDIKNSCMFRDGSIENMKFQNMILEYRRDKKLLVLPSLKFLLLQFCRNKFSNTWFSLSI